MLEQMVKNGASINEVEEKEKFTPLHTACNFGALEVSQLVRCVVSNIVILVTI